MSELLVTKLNYSKEHSTVNIGNTGQMSKLIGWSSVSQYLQYYSQ